MSDDALHPFRVEVTDHDLDELRTRVVATRWPNRLDGSGWDDGVDLTYLQDLAAYWVDQYDWRASEARLNTWPQVTTEIFGQRIHAISARSPEPDALPLVLTHGWPGSVSEFVGLIDRLADPAKHGGDRADAFHVVVPSLPGFGFSGPTTRPGWDVHRVAEAWAVLMERLGYDRYGAHGGDWGAAVSRCLGHVAPERLVGMHVTMFGGDPDGDPMDDLDEREIAAFQHARRMDPHRGYIAVQSTRPQTLGYSLDDSPVGLLAWIADKFWAWTDNDDEPDVVISRDELLTNVSIYWFTRTATSAARIYYETIGRGGVHAHTVETPLGVAVFPKEISASRRTWIERDHNLVHWSEQPRGGHFPALEAPDLLVDDLRRFFRLVRD